MSVVSKIFRCDKICENCSNLVPIGEGDHICMEGIEPKMPLCEYEPTDDYMWCGGEEYTEI